MHSGHPQEASDAFLSAVEHEDPATRFDTIGQAAVQLLLASTPERGTPLLFKALDEAGVPYSRTAAGASSTPRRRPCKICSAAPVAGQPPVTMTAVSAPGSIESRSLVPAAAGAPVQPLRVAHCATLSIAPGDGTPLNGPVA